MPLTQAERERRELAHWAESENERPGELSLDMLMVKFTETGWFTDTIADYDDLLSNAKRVLEIGGGQCWASCILKLRYPGAEISASDISPEAIRGVAYWSTVFRAAPDRTFSCRSFDIPSADGYYDLVFTFQAAHHFGDHRRTLSEAHRVLRPGGALMYLHEPACSALTYPIAYRRVNARRPEVEEDLLKFADMERLAQEMDFDLTIRNRTDMTRVGLTKNIYYTILRHAPLLKRVVPNATDFIFTKRSGS